MRTTTQHVMDMTLHTEIDMSTDHTLCLVLQVSPLLLSGLHSHFEAVPRTTKHSPSPEHPHQACQLFDPLCLTPTAAFKIAS